MDATARQRIVAAGIITKAAEELQIANMRLANYEYLVVSAELIETARNLKNSSPTIKGITRPD
ncbi:hypothetical protein ACKKJR_001218 [Salmonella enterica subsp. enterica serovar Bareilly]